jgi:hypothetical protein
MLRSLARKYDTFMTSAKSMTYFQIQLHDSLAGAIPMAHD